MKKFLLTLLGAIALSGFYNTQCFTLWPSNLNDATTYDLTQLKDYIAETKAVVRFVDQKDTLYLECRVIAPANPIEWLKKLPYITNVNVLAHTTDYCPDCLPLIPWVTYHMTITLKPRAFHDLVNPNIQAQ